MGLTGERNRRQARSREASAAGTRAAARGPARTDRRSAATACGEGGGDRDGDLDDVWDDGEEGVAQQETAREMVTASFRGRGGCRNRRRSILCPSATSGTDLCAAVCYDFEADFQGRPPTPRAEKWMILDLIAPCP